MVVGITTKTVAKTVKVSQIWSSRGVISAKRGRKSTARVTEKEESADRRSRDSGGRNDTKNSDHRAKTARAGFKSDEIWN
jgi:hypothetical protein